MKRPDTTIVVVIGLVATLAIADNRVSTLDAFVVRTLQFLEEPEPSLQHPRNLKHHYERLGEIQRLVIQLDDDIDARSHPRTVSHTIAELAGHLIWLDEVYARTTVAGSSR